MCNLVIDLQEQMMPLALQFPHPYNSRFRSSLTVTLRDLCILLQLSMLMLAVGLVHGETTVTTQPAHTVWSTPGALVEVRLPRHHALTARLLDAPEEAVLLDNPDGGHSFFWVPSTIDIGVRVVTVRFSEGVDRSRDYQLQLDILESASLPPRLNPLPELKLSSNSGQGITDEIHQLAAGQTYELLAIARDNGQEPPLLNLHGAASAALWKPVSDSSYQLQWTPSEADIGYSNLTIYAVDGERPAQYSSRNLNLLVHAEPQDPDRQEWLDKRFDEQLQRAPLEPVRTSNNDQQGAKQPPSDKVVSGALP